MTEKKSNLHKLHRKKDDMSKNSDGLKDKIKNINFNKLHPLRINKQTVIFVKEEKCNKEYAELYRRNILKNCL